MYQTLQEYADAYWEGDKFRALHDLLFHADSDKGNMDDYIPQLDKAEAHFVYDSMKLHAHYTYGSETGFKNAVKAEAYASSLDMELEEIRENKKNPFVKNVLWNLVIISGVIGLIVLCSWLTNIGVISEDFSLIAAIPTILCGVAALTSGKAIFKFFLYKKAYRAAQNAPIPDKDAYIPTFEECMEFHRQREAELAAKKRPQ